MITIISNGSKFAGQTPDSIEKLLEVLGSHTLDPAFENYGNFVIANPVSAYTSKPLYPPETYHFFGNFRGVSHVFNIVTDEPYIIESLSHAIRANQATSAYRQTREAMVDRLKSTAIAMQRQREERDRNRRTKGPKK